MQAYMTNTNFYSEMFMAAWRKKVEISVIHNLISLL